MGYLFLGVSLLCGTAKGYYGKKTSGYAQGYENAIFISIVRMVFCTGIALALLILSGNTNQLAPSGFLLAVSAFSGAFTAIFVVSWLVCIRKSAYMMLDVFLTLGIIVPLACSSIFWGEGIRPMQWAGLGVMTVGALTMCSYHSGVKGKLGIASVLLLILCGMSNGWVDFSQKLFVENRPEAHIPVFQFYTYLFCTIILFALYSAMRIKKAGGFFPRKKVYPPRMYGYIFIMSACLFGYSYFKTRAAVYLDAVQLYPLSQGGAMILSTVMSAALLHEKITVKSLLGTALAFIGLIGVNSL